MTSRKSFGRSSLVFLILSCCQVEAAVLRSGRSGLHQPTIGIVETFFQQPTFATLGGGYPEPLEGLLPAPAPGPAVSVAAAPSPIQDVSTTEYKFEGDYATVVGANKAQFIEEATNAVRSFGLVCIDVRPGSIIAVFSGATQALSGALSSIEAAGGLLLPTFGNLVSQTKEPAAPYIPLGLVIPPPAAPAPAASPANAQYQALADQLLVPPPLPHQIFPAIPYLPSEAEMPEPPAPPADPPPRPMAPPEPPLEGQLVPGPPPGPVVETAATVASDAAMAETAAAMMAIPAATAIPPR